MNPLQEFAVHARRMATAEHKPECRLWVQRPGRWADWEHPSPECPGCVTDAERVLWARLADETDAYLDRPVERGLFASEEPA